MFELSAAGLITLCFAFIFYIFFIDKLVKMENGSPEVKNLFFLCLFAAKSKLNR